MKKEYYIDSCIWLNLFKNEGDSSKGVPYWKIAKEFIEKIEENGDIIIVSTIVLKELQFKLEGKFEEVKQFFQETEFIHLIKTTNEDYDLAREFERQHGLLSFYDYLHTTTCLRLNAPLITRDRDLIEFALNQIEVFKPEELFC